MVRLKSDHHHYHQRHNAFQPGHSAANDILITLVHGGRDLPHLTRSLDADLLRLADAAEPILQCLLKLPLAQRKHISNDSIRWSSFAIFPVVVIKQYRSRCSRCAARQGQKQPSGRIVAGIPLR